MTPLELAARLGHGSIFELLLKRGATLEQTDATSKDGKSNMEMFLCFPEQNRLSALTLLMAAGAAFDAQMFASNFADYFYCPSEASEEDREAALTLALCGAIGVKAPTILQHMRFNQEHLHQDPNVPESLAKFGNGSLYRLNLKDLCRIAIRKELVKYAERKSLLSIVPLLPGPEVLKDFLAFGTLKSKVFPRPDASVNPYPVPWAR